MYALCSDEAYTGKWHFRGFKTSVTLAAKSAWAVLEQVFLNFWEVKLPYEFYPSIGRLISVSDPSLFPESTENFTSMLLSEHLSFFSGTLERSECEPDRDCGRSKLCHNSSLHASLGQPCRFQGHSGPAL